MQSRWSASDAKDFVTRYAAKGVNEDLAICTYTTRLLGSDPRLVLQGGGNTSVKTQMKDLLGEDVEVICIKGSGWDMGNIEPQGLPAVKLEPLRRLRKLDRLSDEDMVNYQRIKLLDSTSPKPTVETRVHAYLPHKFIDHVHSTAVLALVDQPDGEAVAREVYGDKVAYVPYTIPGFALAKSVADVFDKNPGVEGLVLLQHGIFTVGDSAKQAYDRMIGSRHPGRGTAGPAEKAARQSGASRHDLRTARDRAHPARRGGAEQECDGRHGQAADPEFPYRPRHSLLCERFGSGALQPAGCGHARPHHPHQELAAAGAGARSGKAGGMVETGACGG